MREASGLGPDALARQAGLSIQRYSDLENCDGDLTAAISLGELGKLSKALGIDPICIFGSIDGGSERLSYADLIGKIKSHITERRLRIDDFEKKIGYSVESALSDPSSITTWNLDCLRAVCVEVGLDWHLVLI
jgi:transcriptional regulator with XRE-family HTH domain